MDQHRVSPDLPARLLLLLAHMLDPLPQALTATVCNSSQVWHLHPALVPSDPLARHQEALPAFLSVRRRPAEVPALPLAVPLPVLATRR